LEAFDSILVVSFGGPEKPDDVLPFLRNVTRGKDIPDDRLAAVGEHYLRFGGRSPINDQARELIAALALELEEHGPQLPIYWGNRNWNPMLTDTLRTMKADGRRNAVAFVTSAYSSYSSCRQYREDMAQAQEIVGVDAPQVTKVRQFFNHPGFIEPMARNTQRALDCFPEDVRGRVRVVFTAHSIPISMANTSRYESQLQEAAALVIERLTPSLDWDLVYQSRSGPPQTPWLAPDICDHLDALNATGSHDVVIVPIGFISDHMEVLYDLDTEALEKGAALGMHIERASTVGTDPQFVSAVRDLINEHVEMNAMRMALGDLGPVTCLGEACCPAPRASVAT